MLTPETFVISQSTLLRLIQVRGPNLSTPPDRLQGPLDVIATFYGTTFPGSSAFLELCGTAHREGESTETFFPTDAASATVAPLRIPTDPSSRPVAQYAILVCATN